jgi:hypothetical protein
MKGRNGGEVPWYVPGDFHSDYLALNQEAVEARIEESKRVLAAPAEESGSAEEPKETTWYLYECSTLESEFKDSQ